MTRKTKAILLSICSISIVVLLIGITYGYYLARIKNNPTNDNIVGNTGKLELEYSDGNGVINSNENIKPGESLPVKIFNVTNNGDLTVKNYEIVLTEVTNTLEIKEDLIYTLTCTSNKGNSCNGVENIIFPSENSVVVLNDIAPLEKQEYSLTVTYKNSSYVQDTNMGALFSAKVDVKDSLYNPYQDGSLAYEIIKNAMNKKEETSTIYSPIPITTPGSSTMKEDERTLSMTQDDYGMSYYYRGNVKDNYIDFNNMCWRIVRIEGDSSIKLILEDKSHTCSETTEDGSNSNIGTGTYGYNSTTIDSKTFRKADYKNCTSDSNTCMKNQFDKWLENNSFNKNLLKNEKWNIGDWETLYPKNESIKASGAGHYDVGRRLRGHQLNDARRFLTKLTTTEKDMKVEDYIGTLTADEVAFSGSSDINNTITYTYLKVLLNNSDSNNKWLLLSPAYRGCNTTSCTDSEYKFEKSRLHNVDNGVRVTGLLIPSIVLKSDIKLIGGDGTKANAYSIE